MNAQVEVPTWIAARQVRAQFTDLSPERIEAAVAHYSGPAKPPSPAPKAHEGPKSSMPAYLARAARNLPTAGKAERVATLQALHNAQIDLF